MNLYAVIILTFILAEFILELVANILNLRALRLTPPEELKDIYQADAYHKSQEYTRDQTVFDFVVSLVSLGLLLFFWFWGGFNKLDLLVHSWGFGNIINGLLYIAILMLAYSAIMLPFSIYSTFVIEQRYGFNRTTPQVFIKDKLKTLLLAILLGIPLLAGILALFENCGSYAWLYCWTVVTLYLLIIEFIAPNWIMPLFNKFTPLEGGELRSSLMAYADSVDFPVKNIFIMDSSKRSSRSNAFFTGFGHNKKIVLFDTLVARHPPAELVAVLAHEVGHYKKNHITFNLVISILHFGLLFFLLSLFINSSGLYAAFYMEQPSVYAGLIFFGLLYTPIEVILSIFLNMLSRRFECAADRFAATTIKDPFSLVNALKRLASDNLSNLTPHPFFVFLHYSHPTLLQRVMAIRSSTINISEKHMP